MHKSALNQSVIHHILLWASAAESNGNIAEKAPVVPDVDPTTHEGSELIKKHVNYLIDKGWLKAAERACAWPEYNHVRLLPLGWEELDRLIREGKIS